MAVFKATASGTLNAGGLPWSFSMLLSGAVSEASAAADFDGAISTLWTTATNGLENFVPTDTSLTQTEVATLDANYHFETVTRTSNVKAGTDANISLPKQTAIVVTTRSALPRRSGIGRWWLPPFAVDTVAAGGVLSSTIQGHLVTSISAFYATLTSDGLTPFIVNRKPLKDGTGAGVTKNLTNFDISNEFRVHRHRMSKFVPTRQGFTI